MLPFLTVRRAQGAQAIADLRQAQPAGMRAKPVIGAADCGTGCKFCMDVCPSQAISPAPLQIDLGRCVLCAECEAVCPQDKIHFNADIRLSSSQRNGLTISAAQPDIDPVRVSSELKKRFGRSLKMRSVSAGGCNACEMEINALGNVNFDLGRYGIDMVASPRHADALVLSGALSRNMASAAQICWDAMPAPKFVIAVGACAISGGVFADAQGLDRSFLDGVQPALYVPGCPPHPLTFITGLMDLLGIDR